MVDLAKFLKENVEGYLFKDLDALIAVGPLPGENLGAVGYPLLITTFAGIELLGALASAKKFDPRSGAYYFTSFWGTYLYPADRQRVDAAGPIYKLVRHGLAHAFVVKGDIVVGKSGPHLGRFPSGAVCIDAAQLAQDLKNSYYRFIGPQVDKTAGPLNRNTMTSRLNEMADEYERQAADLARLDLPLVSMSPAHLGESGGTGSALVVASSTTSASSSYFGGGSTASLTPSAKK